MCKLTKISIMNHYKAIKVSCHDNSKNPDIENLINEFVSELSYYIEISNYHELASVVIAYCNDDRLNSIDEREKTLINELFIKSYNVAMEITNEISMSL